MHSGMLGTSPGLHIRKEPGMTTYFVRDSYHRPDVDSSRELKELFERAILEMKIKIAIGS